MPTPKVFEIAFKTEVEAVDLNTAILEAKKLIASNTHAGVQICHGIIRDDNLFNGTKDIVSRDTNHIAVLDPIERQELESIISQLSSLSAPISKIKCDKLHNRAINILD